MIIQKSIFLSHVSAMAELEKILLAAQDRFGVKIVGLVKSQAASQEGPYARRIQP